MFLQPDFVMRAVRSSLGYSFLKQTNLSVRLLVTCKRHILRSVRHIQAWPSVLRLSTLP